MTTECAIPSATGSLAALLDLPNKNSFPLVVLLHGFTGWKEEEHLASLAADLCAAGIGALRYDAPGSGESEGSFANEYRVTNYLASVQSVLDFASRQFRLTPDSQALWGHSLGGFIAIASAAQHGKVAAVCGSQPSAGKRQVQSDELDRWRESGWASFPNSRFGTLDLPYSYHEDRQQYDLFEMIEGLRAPLMLISGTFDELVPAKLVRSIYEVAPQPKTYREFPAGHDYKFHEDVLAAINSTTVEFFVRQLEP